MTPERKSEIEKAIIRAISVFGIDKSSPYQKMGLIGLYQMRRDIPRHEFMSVLQSMEGVVFNREQENYIEVRLPTSLFL